MALIQYIEPVSLGELFSGIGILAISLVIAWLIYRVYGKAAEYLDLIINREAKYELIEELYVDELAKKKGYDLDKELIKRRMMREEKPKKLKEKVQEQIYNEMFPEKKGGK